MSLGKTMRERRKHMGLSQVQLAASSGVSLATVQSIERDRANPALSTMRALAFHLGLDLKLESEPIDWPLLVAAGVPISVTSEQVQTLPDKVTILRELRKALAQTLSGREESAIAGFVLAIETHFPDVAAQWLSRAALERLAARFDEPQTLKLKRIATAKIAKYL
jgi:DNA-binding XRE family transcriptional regulator